MGAMAGLGAVAGLAAAGVAGQRASKSRTSMRLGGGVVFVKGCYELFSVFNSAVLAQLSTAQPENSVSGPSFHRQSMGPYVGVPISTYARLPL